jgi:hypothetical protein
MPVILLYHPHILLFFPAHHLLDLYLQKEEVDWAGFINIKEAYGKVSRAQLIILDRLS